MMEYLTTILDMMAEEFLKMWWFILLSIVVAALIKTYKLDLRLRTHLNKRSGAVGIVLATITGIISPLCSCGILPIAISLSAAGVSIPIVMALLITSPIMGPDAIFITEAGLGMEFAILKTVTAVIMGLFAGFFTQFLVNRGIISNTSFRLKATKKDDGSMPTPYEISCENDFTIPTMTVIPRENKFIFFLDRFKDVGVFMVKVLTLAFLLEALILTFVPMEVVTLLVGKDRFFSIFLSALVGLPLPVNQISVVPILAALMQMGISKAAALTLLVAGPVSSFPAMLVLYAMFDKKVFFNYIFVSLFGAMMLGYTYMLFFL